MHLFRSLALVLLPALLVAQDSQPSIRAPQLVTSATAEVALKPDRATLLFTVESRGTTAAKAGAESSRKQRGVIDTLRALGVAADQMQTASLQINPEYVYPGENKPPRVSGYVARSSIRVEVLKIELVGALIDAALSMDATGIGSLSFRSSQEDAARRQALEQAVTKARADADAMAKAAGGAIGLLIELQAQPSYERPMPVSYAAGAGIRMAKAEAMPVEAGEIKVGATVNGRWGFIPR